MNLKVEGLVSKHLASRERMYEYSDKWIGFS